MLECTCEKLAFANPAATKWTYNVMPLGLVNGPYNFMSFILDMDSIWKRLVATCGISIDKHTNARIKVDDILSWNQLVSTSLPYIEYQLLVC